MKKKPKREKQNTIKFMIRSNKDYEENQKIKKKNYEENHYLINSTKLSVCR